MKIDWEFSKNGVVTSTASTVIPMEGLMTATVMAVPVTAAKVAPAAIANKGRFAFLLTARDAVFAKASAGTSALTRLAEKAHLGGAVRWLRARFSWAIQKMSWIPRILGKSGLAGLAALLLTTKAGHTVIKTTVGAVLKPIGWAISKVYNGIGWCMRLFGAPGKRLANRMDKLVYGAIDTVISKTQGIRDWIAEMINPDNRAQKVAAGVGKALVAQAVIAAIVPGAWVWLGYAIAAPLLFEQVRPAAVKRLVSDLREEAAKPVKPRAKKAPAPSLADRVSAKKVAAEIRVEDDKFAKEMHVLEGEVLDHPVLSTGVSKAERRKQAEAARKENEARQRAEAAERRERAAAARREAAERTKAKLAKAPEPTTV